MRFLRGVLIGALLTTVGSCAAVPTTSSTTGTFYTCCEEADVTRPYQPGDTLVIHWIPISDDLGQASPPPELELNARLVGPYATVSDLKQANEDGQYPAAPVTYTAEPVRPSSQPGKRPVSTIMIPPTAVPGFYNLMTSVDGIGFRLEGASVIEVIPGT